MILTIYRRLVEAYGAEAVAQRCPRSAESLRRTGQLPHDTAATPTAGSDKA